MSHPRASTVPSLLSSMRQKLLSLLPWLKKKLPAPSSTILPPIHRLSTPLLIEIFHHCSELHTDLPFPPRPKLTHSDAKIYISQVCHRWRTIMLKNKELECLWGHYTIRRPCIDKSEDGARSYTTALDRLLTTSKNGPLKLHLVHLDRPLVTCILQHIYRCHALLLTMDTKCAHDMLILLSHPKVVQLEVFSIETTDTIHVPLDLRKLKFPNLHWQNLRILNWDFNCISTPSPFPFPTDRVMPRLEAIDLRLPRVSSDRSVSRHLGLYISFLRHCPSLQILSIDIEFGAVVPITSNEDDNKKSHLECSTIQILSLKSRTTVINPLQLLHFFTLPSLTDLSLYTTSTPSSSSTYTAGLEPLTSFIHRSGPSCVLKNLTLNQTPPPADSFAGYITHPCLQNVEALCIQSDGSFSGIGDRTLRLLRYYGVDGDGNQRLSMPFLRSIELSHLITTDGLFAEMVSSRFNAPDVVPDNDTPTGAAGSFRGQLEDVRASFALYQYNPLIEASFQKRSTHTKDYQALEVLARRGLDVKLVLDPERLVHI